MRKIHFFKVLLLTAVAGFAACTSDEPKSPESPDAPDVPGTPADPASPAEANSVFVINEGQYNYGNGSLSLYDTKTSSIKNDLFRTANGFGPGDIVQSMTISEHTPYAWLVVNNSQVIFAIDPETYKEKGRIAGDIVSPRQIEFISPDKAYVTQFYTNSIAVVDPKTFTVTKQLEYPIAPDATGSTGEMVAVDGYMYVCCPNYNSALLKIDTATDRVVDVAYPGIQPSHIVVDANKDLWVLCDGGYQGSPYGYEAPRLVRISTADFKVKAELKLNLGDYVSVLAINGTGDRLYWLNSDVYAMDITSQSLPVKPLIEQSDAFFYGLTIDPATSEVYVTDAVDFAQPGRLLRYPADGGTMISSVTTGVCPHAFCWK